MSSVPAVRIVVRETRRSNGLLKVLAGVLGLGLVAGIIALRSTLARDPLGDPLVAIATAVAVVVIGGATLLAWRRSGEYEVVERTGDRIRLSNSLAVGPLYDAAVVDTKVQRFSAPGGHLQLFLRDGVRAVEVGGHMTQTERERLLGRLEALLAD